MENTGYRCIMMLRTLLLAAVGLFLFVGCGAVADQFSSSISPAAEMSRSSSGSTESATFGMEASSMDAMLGEESFTSSGQSQYSDRMVVRNASLTLAVDSVPRALEAVRGLTEGIGGFVSGSSSYYQDGVEYATLTLRVPSSAYTHIITSLRKLAVRVENEDSTARDVTEEYTDLDAQIRNLQAAEAQLLELMKRAVTVEEMLKVQVELTNTRGMIERIQGRMNVLERTSDMSTVVVSLVPVIVSRGGDPIWEPLETVREAWEESLAIIQDLADLGIRMIVFSWWLIPPAFIGWLIWRLTTRRPPPSDPQN